jgi:hypothetical protein
LKINVDKSINIGYIGNMKIGLLKLEKYTNIAIEKLRLYHQLSGDNVEDYNNFNQYDLVYVSKIFSYTKDYPCIINADKIIFGGTGYDVKSCLPFVIENMHPKINIGFTSRGCIRNCDFCIVKEKEGDFRIIGDIYDFWDGMSDIVTILDNNILADKIHFKNICQQINGENIKEVDFNQGLDIRLLDEIDIKILRELNIKTIRFAADNFNILKIIREKIKIITKYIPVSKLFFYVLVGNKFEDLSDNLYVIQYLRNIGCSVFTQVYLPRGVKEKKSIHHSIFDELARFGSIQQNRNLTFEMFLKNRNNIFLLKDYYKNLYGF